MFPEACQQTGVNKGTKQTPGTVGIVLMACQTVSEIPYLAENYLFNSLDKAAEVSVLTGKVFIGRMVN